jgi:hypothetical protein
MFSIKNINEKIAFQEFIQVKKLVPQKKYRIYCFERYTTKFGDRISLKLNEGKCFLPQRFNNALTDQHVIVYNNAIQEKTKNYFVISGGPIGKTTIVKLEEKLIKPLELSNAKHILRRRESRRRCVKCYSMIAQEHGRKQAQRKSRNVKWYCDQCRKTFCVPCFENIHKSLVSL